MTPLVTTAGTVQCPHGAPATLLPGVARVLAGGAPVAVLADTAIVAGCAFAVGPKPQPCVTAAWFVAAARVLIGGQPALVQAATGLCRSAEGIPAGPPLIAPAQARALGS
ncbi:DUF4280 domain-containing protein [Roseomonas populi]|uniref:DUF4280 domain-containing protein n=1 Tax=Roseomonas populi TaxID=3121582 RepID=A0ABT1X5T8_9PROT|nr:DUF4280 domain-containing protein [Roseomonas pecuniae]MCR0982758.1 DUF4280 domain-containing protein [Roseomonas pecuniae]